MARIITPLTNTQVKQAKPKDKLYKLADGGGLQLRVKKHWSKILVIWLLQTDHEKVHHIDHDHTNNPNDGSNWELLCIYCHDNEHAKYTEHAQYQTEVKASDTNQYSATYNPFADLKSMLKK